MDNNQSNKSEIHFGEIYWVEFDGQDHVMRGIHPALIIQNDIGNHHSPNTIVFPLTTANKRISQPTHVFLPAANTGLPKDSMVLCENPTTVSKNMVHRFITSLSDEYLLQVKEAAQKSMPILAIDPES